jgi:hypothetical protein
MKRPTIAPPQYSGTCLPASSAPRPSTSLHQVVDDQRTDRDFRADVQEDAQRAEGEARRCSISKAQKVHAAFRAACSTSALRWLQTTAATTASAIARPM